MGHFATSIACYCAENATASGARTSISDVRAPIIGLILAAAVGLVAAADAYSSAKQKLGQIESGKLKTGARVTFTPPEIGAYVAKEAPNGVRNPRLELQNGVAKGSALVDFGKVRRAQGYQPGWLMGKLLDGERPVSVTARIRSGGGKATVDVQSVEVSGMTVDGRMLDFLIENFLLAMYPDAVVGRPFELGHRIDRLEVAPGAVGVVIGK
jgi:hypothetical protein